MARGFTLIQMLITLLIIGILGQVAWRGYREQMQLVYLHEAHAALLENAHFLHRHYRQHTSFKVSSNQWPLLPISETKHYCIKLQGHPRGTNEDEFTIKAVPKNFEMNQRILFIDQHLSTKKCEKSLSRCDDGLFFPNSARADDECTLFP